MKRFEYQIKKFDGKGLWGGKLMLPEIVEELNQLGRDGWEMVSMMDTNSAYGETRWVIATLKREVV